jgi:hypothetical protein
VPLRPGFTLQRVYFLYFFQSMLLLHRCELFLNALFWLICCLHAFLIKIHTSTLMFSYCQLCVCVCVCERERMYVWLVRVSVLALMCVCDVYLCNVCDEFMYLRCVHVWVLRVYACAYMGGWLMSGSLSNLLRRSVIYVHYYHY